MKIRGAGKTIRQTPSPGPSVRWVRVGRRRVRDPVARAARRSWIISLLVTMAMALALGLVFY